MIRLIANFLPSLPVKEFWKSANIWQRYWEDSRCISSISCSSILSTVVVVVVVVVVFCVCVSRWSGTVRSCVLKRSLARPQTSTQSKLNGFQRKQAMNRHNRCCSSSSSSSSNLPSGRNRCTIIVLVVAAVKANGFQSTPTQKMNQHNRCSSSSSSNSSPRV